MRRVQNANEVLTGGFLCLAAVVAAYLAWPLSSGVDVGIGPGYVPKALALIQFGLGAALIAHGFVSAGEQPESERPEPWRLRPLALILGSIAFFAATIDRLGLVVALCGLVLISCTANREMRPIETVALAAGSVLFCVVVFVKALKLSVRLWPAML